MNIVRWTPFNELVSLNNVVDRFLQDSVVRGNGSTTLPLDVITTNTELVIKASLAGVSPENIEVTVEGDCLTIKGERKEEREIKDANYVRQERHYGSFYRQVVLPDDVRASDANASCEDGVLTITMPKTEQAKPRQIKVQTSTKS